MQGRFAPFAQASFVLALLASPVNAGSRDDVPVVADRYAQAIDQGFSKKLEKQFGFDKPYHERLALMADGAQVTVRHGISAFGQLKYPKDFKAFEYVNPDAPKGGRISMIGTAGRITFDSFNDFLVKGDTAQGLEYLYDTLMTRAWDEPDALYGLVAETAIVAPDTSWVTFALRPEATFADGKKITVDDVIFTFETLKSKGHPRYALPLRDVASAEALDPRTVRFTFKGNQTRDLPQFVAQLPILPKHYYDTHDFTKTTLERPLGSGPYEIGKFEQGKYVTYKRRNDYWAKDLNVNRGRFNFDELRYEYYLDRNTELEALKAGSYDLREEFTSRDWANAYDIPQVKSGRIVKEELPDFNPSGTQGFFLNIRRKKFQDVRVRQALDYAFDFEWTKKTLFFGAYERTGSYFENSTMKASGKPTPEELALLEPHRTKLPTSVFGEPYTPPVSNGSGKDRKMLRRARDLLAEAGFTFKGRQAIGPDGKPFTIEFLIYSPGFEKIMSFYAQNLRRIGIDATIRRVDPPQYERRSKSFDFDIIVQRYTLGLTPGPELRAFWGSNAANLPGSFNLAGIADPVVDALIEKVLQANNREELTTATRALDRVLRAGHYWVSNWYNKAHRMAYWNKFSRPATKPRYNRGVIQTWWFDPVKAAKLEQP